MPNDDTALVQSYIGKPIANLNWARRMALRSEAYYKMIPYPVFGFQQWKSETRGPLPKAMPFVPNIIKRGAKWLFGRPPRITCTNKDATDKVLKKFQELYPELKRAARRAMIEGSIMLRFSVDYSKQECYFSFLSGIENVHFIYDPHDKLKVIVAFVQYPYYDATENCYMMHREAWTDNTYIKFKPTRVIFQPVQFSFADQSPNEAFSFGNIPFVENGTKPVVTPELFENWEIDGNPEVNRLGFIPIVQIRDDEGDTQFGEGCLWFCTHVIDRVHLAYHLMDKSNQFDSEPTIIFIDSNLTAADNTTMAPGGQIQIDTKEVIDGGTRQAKAQLIEPSGRLRGAMSEYTVDLRKQLCDFTGSVEIGPDEIANKGNLTQSVLNQIYEPLIASTDMRRTVYESKLEHFLGLCSERAAPFLGYKWNKGDSYNLQWPAYFIVPEAEKTLTLDRLIKEEGLGLTTKDRVIMSLAEMDGIEDVDKYMEELESYEPQFKDELDSSKKNNPTTETPESRPQAKPKSETDKTS